MSVEHTEQMKLTRITASLDLGEAPLWHHYRNSWCWVDISNSRLYELQHDQASKIAPAEHTLPVPQPGSCCFGGPEGKHLLITSAREGLSTNELDKYPFSGCVFLVELDVVSAKVPAFKLGKARC